MSLKLIYMGQNDSFNCTPDVVLTGDPGTDQGNLSSAGYLGGRIMALKNPGTNVSGTVIVPCDSASQNPFATLLNGPGEFAGAISPSGSKKAPVVRALWQGIVDSQAYDATETYVVGAYLFCGETANSLAGYYVPSAGTHGASSVAVGICTHIPTAAEPWLGVASLL